MGLRYEYGGPPRCGNPGPSEIVVGARIPASLDDPNVVGLAEMLTDAQGYIRRATVYFDPQYRDDTLMSILCHEAGHALGLSHPSGNASCMRTPADRPSAATTTGPRSQSHTGTTDRGGRGQLATREHPSGGGAVLQSVTVRPLRGG